MNYDMMNIKYDVRDSKMILFSVIAFKKERKQYELRVDQL